MRLERTDIENLLPHREPLLLPANIEIEVPGSAGVGQVSLAPDRRLWDDWTGADLVDELILEAAAQVLGVVMSTGPDRTDEDRQGQRRLLSFDKVEFTRRADPSAVVRIEVRVQGRFGAVSAGTFRASQSERTVAAGQIGVMGG